MSNLGLGVFIVFVEDDLQAAEVIALYKGALNQITGDMSWLRVRGDVNGDGVIGLDDERLMAKAYGSKPGDANWNPACDLNQDGIVDDADIDVLRAHFGQKAHIVGEDVELMDSDLIVVGGWVSNPYTEEYFHKPGLVNVNGGKLVGKGVYADGKRCVFTVTRTNGTMVTAVFGLTKEDTYETAKDYVGVGAVDLKALGIAGAVIVSGITTGYTVAKALRR